MIGFLFKHEWFLPTDWLIYFTLCLRDLRQNPAPSCENQTFRLLMGICAVSISVHGSKVPLLGWIGFQHAIKFKGCGQYIGGSAGKKPDDSRANSENIPLPWHQWNLLLWRGVKMNYSKITQKDFELLSDLPGCFCTSRQQDKMAALIAWRSWLHFCTEQVLTCHPYSCQ